MLECHDLFLDLFVSPFVLFVTGFTNIQVQSSLETQEQLLASRLARLGRCSLASYLVIASH
jgi:hypothetical protein